MRKHLKIIKIYRQMVILDILEKKKCIRTFINEYYSFTPILRWDLAAIFIQLLPRLKSLQIGIHEVSDLPEVV